MRIKVTKPVEGATSLTFDDKRGVTRKYTYLPEVPVSQVAEAAQPILAAWEQAKADRKNRSG